ncbi:kelch repeat protein [Colletotrichum camelliae]|nr:kelch repeat protein [Colletotrichum camelliae]
MASQALWVDATTNSFYIWGGHSPNGNYINKSLASTIWRFQADGEGGGIWSEEQPANPTEYEVQAAPGVLSFDFRAKRLKNDTTQDVFPPYGTSIGGSATYIPVFGDNGLIMVMGGYSQGLGSNIAGQKPPIHYTDFTNLTFMDPVTKVWYWQVTTGDAPTPRGGFCSVGVEGINGTYDIFVFGGHNPELGAWYDDTYVLSLPGFVWTQIKRCEGKLSKTKHACAVIGHRQMLSVGGMGMHGDWSNPDPYPQGLAIFDMTEWTWSQDYDADAKEYVTHEKIQNWYQDKGVESVQWPSEITKTIFTGPRADTSSYGNTNQSALTAGVIAGSIVMLWASSTFGVFWLFRCRKQKEDAVSHQIPSIKSIPDTRNSPMLLVELWAGPTPRYELPGSDYHHDMANELDAQNYSGVKQC